MILSLIFVFGRHSYHIFNHSSISIAFFTQMSQNHNSADLADSVINTSSSKANEKLQGFSVPLASHKQQIKLEQLLTAGETAKQRFSWDLLLGGWVDLGSNLPGRWTSQSRQDVPDIKATKPQKKPNWKPRSRKNYRVVAFLAAMVARAKSKIRKDELKVLLDVDKPDLQQDNKIFAPNRKLICSILPFDQTVSLSGTPSQSFCSPVP